MLAFPEPPADAVVALRPWEDADMDLLVAGGNDPDVARFTRLPSPYTRADARAWITSATWLLALGREAHLALADATAPERPALGACALLDLDRAAGSAEVGFWLVPGARGRGLATRAVGLLSAWAFEPLGLKRVRMRIDPGNAASLRVAARSGFTELDHRDSSPHRVFTLTPPG